MTTLDGTPIAPPAPRLVQSSLSAFRALLWVGITLAVVAAASMIIGLTTSDYEAELKFSAYSFAGSTTLHAVILLAAAGVVAGLGKRETHDTTTS